MEEQSTKCLNEEESAENTKPDVASKGRKISAFIPTLVKISLLMISSLCFCLIFVPYDNRLQRNIHRAGVAYSAFIITAISNLIFLATQCCKNSASRLITNSFSTAFGILLSLAGYFIISDWRTLTHSLYYHPPKMFMDMMICSGVFAIFGSIISFANIYITQKYL